MSFRERINRLKQLEMEIMNRITAENQAIYDKMARLSRLQSLISMPASALIMRGINPLELIQQIQALEREIERERDMVSQLVMRRQEVTQQILALEAQLAAVPWQTQQAPLEARLMEEKRRRDIEFLMQELNEAVARRDVQTARVIRDRLRSLGVWWV